MKLAGLVTSRGRGERSRRRLIASTVGCPLWEPFLLVDQVVVSRWGRRDLNLVDGYPALREQAIDSSASCGRGQAAAISAELFSILLPSFAVTRPTWWGSSVGPTWFER